MGNLPGLLSRLPCPAFCSSQSPSLHMLGKSTVLFNCFFRTSGTTTNVGPCKLWLLIQIEHQWAHQLEKRQPFIQVNTQSHKDSSGSVEYNLSNSIWNTHQKQVNKYCDLLPELTIFTVNRSLNQLPQTSCWECSLSVWSHAVVCSKSHKLPES